jgi:hypothetical protein
MWLLLVLLLPLLVQHHSPASRVLPCASSCRDTHRALLQLLLSLLQPLIMRKHTGHRQQQLLHGPAAGALRRRRNCQAGVRLAHSRCVRVACCRAAPSSRAPPEALQACCSV